MKIACIGNATFDMTVSGNEFIKEGVRNSYTNATFTAGGPASNAASVIGKFGGNVDFYGQIGKDVNGEFIYKEMLSENINLKHLKVTDKLLTPFSFIIINTFNNTRTICPVRNKEDLIKANIEEFSYEKDYDYILTDGKYVDNTIELIKNNPKAVTIIDAGRVNDGVIKLCHMVDYIICSEEFASEVTEIDMVASGLNDEIVYKKMKKIFPNAKGITITVGGRGYVSENDNKVITNPAYDSGMRVVDTNAAGDIFHGAFTYALSSGYDYYEALEFANITASLSTTKSGGRKSIPGLNEVINNKSKRRVKK